MTNMITILVMLLLTGAAPVLAQSDTKEQLTVPLTDSGKPGFLEVGLIQGFIHVVGYSGKEVVIDAVAETGKNSRNNDHSTNRNTESGMRRISTKNSFDLTAEEKNNRVKVHTSSINNPVNLTIKVPQRFSLKLNTVSQGDITVENVTGELEINNVSGPITLTNISGSVVAQTVSGDLKTTFREVNNNTPMAFSTLSGNVDVTFPASVKANVKLKSDNGDIFSDFDIDVDKSQPKTTRTNQSGMYRVSVDDWVYGKINNGGPEVMMKNMQGNIYVRKSK